MAEQVKDLAPGELTARLAQIRTEIDGVDHKLLELFNQRAGLSLEVGRIKANASGSVFKPLREHEVLESLVAQNVGPLPADHLRAIWREIFSSSRALQRPQRVAYLGPEGTFSYFAGVEYFGHAAIFQPCKDIPAIFDNVCNHQCELGVVPLENSLQGTVGVSFDLFLNNHACIQAELFSRISHCLLGDADSLASVRTVYSHAQGLAQCGNWLATHLPHVSLIPVESTAAAAQRALGCADAAAIGNCRLADMLGIGIMARRIEDASDNWTRFVIIAPEDRKDRPTPVPGPVPGLEPGKGNAPDKTSILFTTADKAGALSSVLQLLAGRGINMRKLESRPMRGQRWKYVFFADVESNLDDPVYSDLLETLRETCSTFRILGTYPSGPQLDRIDERHNGETA